MNGNQKHCPNCKGTKKVQTFIKGKMTERDCPACGGTGVKQLQTK